MQGSLHVVDMHTGGEPLRIVTDGYPPLPKGMILEKRAFVRDNLDHLRRLLMFEPRGHDMMSGSILYPPTRPDCEVAVLFIETSGCLPMCGHGTIGTITMAIEKARLHCAVYPSMRVIYRTECTNKIPILQKMLGVAEVIIKHSQHF